MAFCSDCGSDIGVDTFCSNCGKQMGEASKKLDANPPGSTQNTQIHQQVSTQVNPHIQSSFRPTQQFPVVNNANMYFPPARSYIKWMAMIFGFIILGIVLFFYSIIQLFIDGSFALIGLSLLLIGFGSIMQLVYQYHNFNDFKKLNQLTHGYQFDKSIDPIVGLLLFFFILPVAFYFKYNQLHEHLTRVHEEPNLPPSGAKVLITLLIPIGIYIASAFAGFASFQVFTIISGISTIASLAIVILFLYYENKWQNVLNRHIQTHQSFVSNK